MTRDEVFVPRTASYHKAGPKGKKVRVSANIELDELLEDAPLYRLFWLVVQQVFGWPAYLFNNASGQLWYPKGTNHFDPNSTIFDKRHRNQVLISDAFLLGMFSLLTVFGHYHGGLAGVVKYYVIPYLGVNHWLVMITYLQHTDPSLPHYGADTWNFQRGALCTMDRNLLGPVGPYLMHGALKLLRRRMKDRIATFLAPGLFRPLPLPLERLLTLPPCSIGICETHICHHLVSQIPHHHAWEATAALKEFLGKDCAFRLPPCSFPSPASSLTLRICIQTTTPARTCSSRCGGASRSAASSTTTVRSCSTATRTAGNAVPSRRRTSRPTRVSRASKLLQEQVVRSRHVSAPPLPFPPAVSHSINTLGLVSLSLSPRLYIISRHSFPPWSIPFIYTRSRIPLGSSVLFV